MFDKVKEALNIRQVVEYYGVKLKGNKALCPFHKEKTMSFSIHEGKQIYNCHTCSDKAGDLIHFVSKLYAIKPFDACKKLSDDFGLGLTDKVTGEEMKKITQKVKMKEKFDKQRQGKIDKYWQLHEIVAEYDKICIDNKPKPGAGPDNLFIYSKIQLENACSELELYCNREGFHV